MNGASIAWDFLVVYPSRGLSYLRCLVLAGPGHPRWSSTSHGPVPDIDCKKTRVRSRMRMNKRVLILKLFCVYSVRHTIFKSVPLSLSSPMLDHGLVKLKSRQSAVRGPWRGWRAGSERARDRS